MSRTEAMALAELLALTPPGAALPVDGSGEWPGMIVPLAAEIAYFEALAEQMLAEVDPSQAQYLLGDYERVLGPDPYGRDTTALTLADQRALTLSRWVTRYGVRPADFIALAASFGIIITITEYQTTTIGATIGATLVNDPVQHSWVVNMPAAILENAYADAAQIGDSLSAFAPSLVQPIISGRAPAQTNPIFNYA